MQGLVALVIGFVPFMVTMPAALAGLSGGPSPTFPTNETIGQTEVPASLQISNASSNPENTGTVTVDTIVLTPACGVNAAPQTGLCPTADEDPGVITVVNNPNVAGQVQGIGTQGTCTGETFNINVSDAATGQLTFVPQGAPVAFGPLAGGGSQFCVISFFIDVNKAPIHATAQPTVNTFQTSVIAAVTVTSSVTGQTAPETGIATVTISKAAPGLTTTATATGKVGSPLTDVAHLSAANPPGPAPGGTITFTAFGPNDPTCAAAGLAYTSTPVPVAGVGDYTSTPAFTPTAPGTYLWIASYSGDNNNAAIATSCGDNGETVTVSQATPAIVTTASAATTIGGPISDLATLSGGFNPTGTIAFTIFNPAANGSAACTTQATPTIFVNVNAGNGTYSSGNFTPPTAGTYSFSATYSGDTNNAGATSACGAANESTTVNKVTPTIATTPSATVVVGGNISDTATLSGGIDNPGGSITFTVFNNGTCAGGAMFTSTVGVAGNGTYSSGNFATTVAGTYEFVATYSGDGNNNGVASVCGTEAVVVTLANPTIATTASPSVPSGSSISDTATLSGGVNPGGTITFKLFGPNNGACAGAAIFTSVVNVTNGNNVYPSGGFTVTTPGVYNWEAAYSGDANNNPATSACGALNESVTVTNAKPTIVTQASPAVAAGGAITDTATLAGGAAPGGTITFSLFGPNNGNCGGAAIFTSVVNVNGNGNYTSGSFTTNAAGSFNWEAAYSGDGNNDPVTSGCGATNESVVVSPVTPTIVTHASAPVAVGGTISDTATLSGGQGPTGPTGNIVFTVFGPNNGACAAPVAFTSTVAVNAGNGTYASGSFPVTAAGTYLFIASYGGDTNNNAVATHCGDANESVVVSPVTPKITTQASGPVAVGASIFDTATFSGGVAPTGSITFSVFGPNDATCAKAPAFQSVVGVNGNGTYSSGNFVTTAAGTYQVVAAYSGDSNNAAVTTLCSDPAESVAVAKATPALVTVATTSGPVGGTVTDTATLSGGVNPGGSITFHMFGPNDTNCTGTFVTSSATVNGNGNYSSTPFTTIAPGTYAFEASYSGDANNSAIGSTACNAANETVTVSPATPAIVTKASASVPAGGTISDTATLSGGVNPGGHITFTLFGPDNANCTGVAIFTSTVAVAGDGNYTSTAFTTTLVGTYRFIATYSGDANNAGVASGCNDANESVLVTPAAPTIVTHASASVAAGGTIADTATLAGGTAPGGTITFTVFGPNNAFCAGPAIFTSVKAVNGNGNYTSDSLPVTAAGTYQFVAVYSGDANNAGATSACGAPNESVVVTLVQPALVTTASSTVVVGGTITDTATLSGGVNPTGTITFSIFGPNDGTCATVPAFTSTSSVNANGVFTSNPFTVTVAGTYRFEAAYSGDTNNSPVAEGCNGLNESVVVTPAVPTIVTVASGSVPSGGTISDIGTLSGGVNPGGTITFQAFGPNNNTCAAGTAIFTSVVNVTGNGSYNSGPFPVTAAGTYQFVVTYSGDVNNKATVSGCGTPGEAVVVTKAGPVINTQPSSTVTLGGTISDTATLTGGSGPTGPGGTLTFNVFGPNNGTCAAPAAFSATDVVAGNGTYLSGPFTPTAPGTYQFVVSYSGDANNNAAVTACGAETVVVTTSNPTITTKVSGSVAVGGTVTDTATLAGGNNPGGTITFQAFGPNNNTCTGIPAFTSTKSVAGNGNYTSDPFTVSAAGSFRFVATYSGDANNSPAGPTACLDANEVASGTKVSPAIATTASAGGVVGSAIIDTAILTGGFNPTGTITFNVFGPGVTTCTGIPAFTSTVNVNGTGNFNSAPFTPTAPGVYTFVASYSGDTNNNAAGPTACNDPNETVTVTPSATTLSTTASPSVDVGQAVFDTATLGSSGHPTGTITFNLFGPNNATCTGTPAFTSVVNVNGAGNYTSGQFVTTAVGTFEFVAIYSGDANNAAVGPTPCNDPAESVVVLPTPQIAVTKVANPLTEPEPGGNFTFTVQVNNPSTVDPVKITSLFDNIYGDLSVLPGSTCGDLIGVTLAPAPAPGSVSPPCTFTGAFTGKGGDSQTDTVTVTGIDSHGITVNATAHATVTLTTILPSISVTKVANPLSEVEPGGTFTFTVVVTNTNNIDPITIDTLNDDVYGNLATISGSTCGALIGTTLAPGASSAPCSFPGTFTGTAGQSQTDTVTVTGHDSHGNQASSTAHAKVVLTPETPVIAVTKAANPLSEVEPGGNFTFTVQVSNPSATDPITINSLTDDVYGNLATLSGSTCGALIGTTLAPGATSAPCTFTGAFTGTAGQSQTDTVTVAGTDRFGHHASNTAHATVTLTPVTPVIAVTKVANPTSEPEPGGNFTFTVQVSNPSATDPITINSLTDDVYGNLATLSGSTCGALIGTTLAPGATSAPCTFTGAFTGTAPNSQTDTVTVGGTDKFGHHASNTAHATVTLTPVTPVIAVTKVANPTSLPAPGGNFTFTVQVSNPSTTDPITITSLTDDIYGDLATLPGSTCGALIGTTLAPGATSAPCTFKGAFTGVGGASQTDTVTVGGTDKSGHHASNTAHATVKLTSVTPVIAVTKVANPLTLPQPGGTFTFTVQVSNPSPDDAVTITSLTDNIYGDLTAIPGSTCGALIGITLAPGATSAPCSFTGAFNGAGGATQTDTVTVGGKDKGGTPVTSTAQATVGITAPPAAPPLAFTGLDDRRPLAVAGGLILVGLLMLGIGWRRRRFD